QWLVWASDFFSFSLFTFHRRPRSGSLPRRAVLERASPELDMRLEFVAVLGHEALHRHREAVGEHANGVAFHVACGVNQGLEILHLAAPRFQLDEQFFDPAASFAARRALSA